MTTIGLLDSNSRLAPILVRALWEMSTVELGCRDGAAVQIIGYSISILRISEGDNASWAYTLCAACAVRAAAVV